MSHASANNTQGSDSVVDIYRITQQTDNKNIYLQESMSYFTAQSQEREIPVTIIIRFIHSNNYYNVPIDSTMGVLYHHSSLLSFPSHGHLNHKNSSSDWRGEVRWCRLVCCWAALQPRQYTCEYLPGMHVASLCKKKVVF